MKTPLGKLSITKRYALFLFAVIVTLLVVTNLMTAKVIRDGLHELFTQRLQRSSLTLERYADERFIRKSAEIEAVVSSPRFIAALKASDSVTIAREAPHYKRLLDVSILFIETSSSDYIYGLDGPDHPDGFDRLAMAQVNTLLMDDISEIHTHYIFNQGELYELFHTDVVTPDGLIVGRALMGEPLSNFIVEDLEQLTGLDVLVTHNNSLVAHSSTTLIDDWITSSERTALAGGSIGAVSSATINGKEILYLTRVDKRVNVAVTFIGDLDAHVMPILTRIRTFLSALAVIAGLITMLLVYYFAARRIGSQMDELVSATERIAGGDLDFHMTPRSHDEFGYLTEVIDKMRSRLREDILELRQEHSKRLDAERLAAIGKSATGIIHDFKGPMALIRGTVEFMLLKRKDDGPLHKQCQTIIQEIDHINELMKDVIEYSHGKFNLKIEPVTLRRYFTDIRETQFEAYSRAGIDLKIESGADYTVRLDPARFRRVIDNILTNAREALKPGQFVEISWEKIESRLLLIIQDNGPGIPEEIRDRLFEPFVTSGKATGTGLGLAISKKIVEDHNATLEIASEKGSGAAFIVTFPESMVSSAE